MNLNSFRFTSLRNSEYFQHMSDLMLILEKYEFVGEIIGCLRCDMNRLLEVAVAVLAVERKNAKVREKNEIDRVRTRLHSRLFNYLKYITYGDDKDARNDDALMILNIMSEVGNPSRLSETAQTAMLTALIARLETHRQTLVSIGASQIVDDLAEANSAFINITDELRVMVKEKKLSETPTSMTALRKEIDLVYRNIVGSINGYARVPSKKEQCFEMITEINVLTARYVALLAKRSAVKSEN